MAAGISVSLPGLPELILHTLLLDFNGTLAVDGRLLPGVAERLIILSARVDVVVATADTHGTAQSALEPLPVKLLIVSDGADKLRFLRTLGPDGVAVIGNGNNDVLMARGAALSVGVLGPEGLAPRLLRAVAVITPSIQDALDLFLHPQRFTATLRR